MPLATSCWRMRCSSQGIVHAAVRRDQRVGPVACLQVFARVQVAAHPHSSGPTIWAPGSARAPCHRSGAWRQNTSSMPAPLGCTSRWVLCQGCARCPDVVAHATGASQTEPGGQRLHQTVLVVFGGWRMGVGRVVAGDLAAVVRAVAGVGHPLRIGLLLGAVLGCGRSWPVWSGWGRAWPPQGNMGTVIMLCALAAWLAYQVRDKACWQRRWRRRQCIKHQSARGPLALIFRL